MTTTTHKISINKTNHH